MELVFSGVIACTGISLKQINPAASQLAFKSTAVVKKLSIHACILPFVHSSFHRLLSPILKPASAIIEWRQSTPRTRFQFIAGLRKSDKQRHLHALKRP